MRRGSREHLESVVNRMRKHEGDLATEIEWTAACLRKLKFDLGAMRARRAQIEKDLLENGSGK